MGESNSIFLVLAEMLINTTEVHSNTAIQSGDFYEEVNDIGVTVLNKKYIMYY